MHIFYFLTPREQFELLKEVSSSNKNDIGLIFRRFTNTGFDSRYEICSWEDDLPKKYLDGGFTQIHITVNGSLPHGLQDWDFLDREEQNLIIIEGGRINNNELEKSYLRVFAKETNCKSLYQRIRKLIKSNTTQGLYSKGSFYKDTFYSEAAAKYKMVSSFGGNEYAKENT
jgi:hypothetical protein